MPKVNIIENDQMLVGKILSEILELLDCKVDNIKAVINFAISKKIFKIDEDFIEFVCCICPLTYRGSISFTNNRYIKDIISSEDYKKFVHVIKMVKKNEYNPEVYNNSNIDKETFAIIETIFEKDRTTIRKLIGIPSLENIKRRHFPLKGEEVLPSFPKDYPIYVDSQPIEKYIREYPIPAEIYFIFHGKKITTSVKNICRDIIQGISSPYEKFLSIEMKMLRGYYRK